MLRFRDKDVVGIHRLREQQRFDKTKMLSFLPLELRGTGATILPRRFKLYHYLSLPDGTEILRWESLAAPRTPLPQDDSVCWAGNAIATELRFGLSGASWFGSARLRLWFVLAWRSVR